MTATDEHEGAGPLTSRCETCQGAGCGECDGWGWTR